MPSQVSINSISLEQRSSTDLVKLIRKLRWIGLEEEAHQLEIVVRKLPPEGRAVVLATTSSTD